MVSLILKNYFTSSGSHPCATNRGLCSDLCLLKPHGGYQCACPTGIFLKPDGRTCDYGESILQSWVTFLIKMFSWGDQLLPPATVNLLRPTNRIGCLAAENHPHTTVTSIKDGGNTFLQSNKATLDIKKKRCGGHMFLIMLGTKSIIIQRLRTRFCKYEKSCDSFKVFNFFLFCPNKPFGELYSKI